MKILRLLASLWHSRRNVTNVNMTPVIPAFLRRKKPEPVAPVESFSPGEYVAVVNHSMARKKWVKGRIQHVHYENEGGDGSLRQFCVVRGAVYPSERLERVRP